ncbi:MAG: UvrD-helicase domain-containing protein [Planctomycetota bacterium]|jgi:DNA helicase-2/ATP-dependent DNA helicase PcrA|nr:UvrD-helicase domain-containing protein [Planctomycetota bacterium]
MKAKALLDDLTPAQREAVTHATGPMLVVAGAGSGKTRVVTRRIARLVSEGVNPWRILALTFPNKAAREMRSRVEDLAGEAPAWMGTFHAVCARMLRFDIGALGEGRDNRFSILDQGDQESLVKTALKRLGVLDKSYRPSSVLSAISRAKSDFIPPEAFPIDSWRDEMIKEAYGEYEKALRDTNSLDFDDLLIIAVRLLQESPETLAKYQRRFPFILVDEYQDTNRAQYLLLKLLAGERRNLHATGDPDQSIYSWRGADYQNIMAFQIDFPGAKLVRLEQNYRSTKTILAAANALIRHNRDRIDKDLFTDNQEGAKVTAAALQSDAMEAAWIAEQMLILKRDGGRYGDMAVFYRTNAQSRQIEEAFMRSGIPYQLVGGVRFYERREIKDFLAHLKIVENPRDLTSLRRIVSCRPTGVGEKTLARIALAAGERDVAPFAFLASDEFEKEFKPNRKTLEFARWARRLAAVDRSRADEAVRNALAVSGLVEQTLAMGDRDEHADDRIDNLDSLVARAREFVQFRTENGAGTGPAGEAGEAETEENAAPAAIDLAAFLEDVALVADVDNWDAQSDRATLMTLHSAKGLEFPDVFVAGLEEGLLPHKNAQSDAAVEEERRLFYVGLTRARRRAWISRAELRFSYGSSDFSAPSRFLQELPEEAVEEGDFADALSLDYGGGFKGPGFRPKASGAADPFADDDGVDFDPGFDDILAGDPPDGPPLRAPASAPSRIPFRSGDLVRHPSFGSGKILTIKGKKILVQFFASGTRLLYLDACLLTRE